MAKINIYSEDWCNLVFDNKNKLYGAYETRGKSGKRHFRALLIASFCFTLAICSPLILKKIMPKPVEHAVDVVLGPGMGPAKKTEKKDDSKKEILPEVPIKASLAFVPPKITADELVTDDDVILSQQDLNESNKAISIKTVVGVDVGGVDVADLDQGTQQIVNNDEPPPLTVVENMPDFPGGDAARIQFLSDNLKYPALARETDIEGTVYVEFVVERNGKITNIKVKRGIGGGCDEEAVRVVKMMPNWNPGRQNGQNVRVQYMIPIKFILH
jgi:periplasmic protein TonB